MNSTTLLNSARRLTKLYHPFTTKRCISTNTGLFSVPELQRPQDFDRLSVEAITTCDGLRSDVRAAVARGSIRSIDSPKLLKKLDDISRIVCNVIDAAELCRSVHADSSWREAASSAFGKLSDYITHLNSDTSLYEALQLANTCTDHFSEEDKRLVVMFKAEFERDGIHLPDEKRQRVRSLQNQITELESSFSSNIVHSEGVFEVTNFNSVRDLINPSVLSQFGYDVSKPTLQLRKNDDQILHTILKYSSNPELRKEAHMANCTSCPENLNVLDDLVRLRHEVAMLQGFPSYMHRNLLDKMMSSGSDVKRFLQGVSNANAAAFKIDMQRLIHAKNQVEGSTEPIQAWDIAFYKNIVKTHVTGDDDMQSKISNYFTVSNSLTAIQKLLFDLFGISMTRTQLTTEERWDGKCIVVGDGTDAADGLHKFSLSSEEGIRLGTLIFDLLPREYKFDHAAHFTVRCGCEVAVNGENKNNNASQEYQLPIVALVMNLSSPDNRITHPELETLFHECGHALHSLLSRTKYQHLSGTRAAMDFVETPSHMLENVVWDPTFLKVLSAESPHGTIPDELIVKLRRSRNVLKPIDRQIQIIYSQFDQQLHGVRDDDAKYLKTMDLYAKIHQDFNYPFAHGTHWFTRFGHLISYGAAYYGYMHAQKFAQDIWSECLEGKLSDRDAGKRLWNNLLSHGGAKDPNIMLDDLLGGQSKTVP